MNMYSNIETIKVLSISTKHLSPELKMMLDEAALHNNKCVASGVEVVFRANNSYLLRIYDVRRLWDQIAIEREKLLPPDKLSRITEITEGLHPLFQLIETSKYRENQYNHILIYDNGQEYTNLPIY